MEVPGRSDRCSDEAASLVQHRWVVVEEESGPGSGETRGPSLQSTEPEEGSWAGAGEFQYLHWIHPTKSVSKGGTNEAEKEVALGQKRTHSRSSRSGVGSNSQHGEDGGGYLHIGWLYIKH